MQCLVLTRAFKMRKIIEMFCMKDKAIEKLCESEWLKVEQIVAALKPLDKPLNICLNLNILQSIVQW